MKKQILIAAVVVVCLAPLALLLMSAVPHPGLSFLEVGKSYEISYFEGGITRITIEENAGDGWYKISRSSEHQNVEWLNTEMVTLIRPVH